MVKGEKKFRRFDPNQSFLIAPSLDDWLARDHLARTVAEIVGCLDLSPIFDRHARELRGAPPFHPEMMVRLLVYAYAVGVRSSRKIWRATSDDVAFRWLAAGNFPDFRVISDFRKNNLDTFVNLFAQVIQLARGSGIVKLRLASIDGSKVSAYASLEKNRTWKDLVKDESKLKEDIRRILKEADDVDDAEDAEYGHENTGYELPPDLQDKTKRLERFRRVKREFEEIAREAKEKHDKKLRERAERARTGEPVGRPPAPPKMDRELKRNLTDPESRVMKGRHGFVQAYNVQASVDTESHLFIGGYVTNVNNDAYELNNNLEEIHANLAQYPERIVADPGYSTEKEIQRTPREITLLIKRQRASRNEPPPPPPRGRIPDTITGIQLADRACRTKQGKREYAKRGTTSEPGFGYLKETLGFKRFLLRGLNKVNGEYKLLLLSGNIRKIWLIGAKASKIGSQKPRSNPS